MNGLKSMRVQRLLLLAFLVMGPFVTASGAEVVRAGRWHLHSSFWMNLHQTLMHDASTRSPRDLTPLTAEQRAIWSAAVDVYRENAGPGSITFSRSMMGLQDRITQIADDAVILTVDGPVGDAMRSVAPLYRAHWWSADDRANRFSMGYAAAMLRDAGEELAVGHEAVYRERLPASIRVDFAPFAGTFGAYTHTLQHGGVTVTISSRDTGYQGLAVLEAVLHESSHAIVFPREGTLSEAIARASKARGIDPPRDLWHAVLFATTSELTKRSFAARGATGYVPYAEDLLTRAWPQYRVPIETFWYPYLSGRGTLEQAIEGVVGAVK